jgi:hypothetical protein
MPRAALPLAIVLLLNSVSSFAIARRFARLRLAGELHAVATESLERLRAVGDP